MAIAFIEVTDDRRGLDMDDERYGGLYGPFRNEEAAESFMHQSGWICNKDQGHWEIEDSDGIILAKIDTTTVIPVRRFPRYNRQIAGKKHVSAGK